MSIKVYSNLEGKSSIFCNGELAYYIEKIFNMSIKDCEKAQDADLVVELKSEEEEREDRISVKFTAGKGRIQSNSQVGILTGIYRFFSEFGVRFLRPGRSQELIVTHNKEVFWQKEIQIEEEASFKHRGVCIEGADSFENVQEFIDWLPKVGYNSFFIQFENPYSFFKRWYEHEFNPYLATEPFSKEIAQEMSDLIDQEISIRGISHHRVGHGWTSEVLGYSSKYGWESGLVLPEDKKALVAELDGERELYGTAPILTSLDFANPEVTKKMVELILDYAKERKDVDYLHVWLSDARNNICECSDCQVDLPSDQYICILNEIDRQLTSEGLETKICFLLYHELLFAPEKEKLNNPDRFTMMFAPITRTFEKSYADVDYKTGIPKPHAYQRNQISLPNSLEENLSYLFSWKQGFKGDSFVYDYPLGRAHYGDLGYMKISQVIARDIKYLNNLELNGYISCQELRAGFPHNFPNYVMGKLLWNDELVYEDLKKEYFQAMYGDNWQEVTIYLEQLSEHSSCDYFNGIGSRLDAKLAVNYQIASNLATDFISTLEKNTNQQSEIQQTQWLQLGYHREYVIKLAPALSALCLGKESISQKTWRDFLDYIRRNELATQRNLDVYRVIEVAKNYTGFQL